MRFTKMTPSTPQRFASTPVRLSGHYKSDAVRIKQLIEHHQTQYYRAPGGAPSSRADAFAEAGRTEVARG